MAKSKIVVVLVAWMMSGCLQDLAECEAEDGEMVCCEDGSGVMLEEELEEDGERECVRDGEEIRCSTGEVLEVVDGLCVEEGGEGNGTPNSSPNSENDAPNSDNGGDGTENGGVEIGEPCVASSAGRIECAGGVEVTDEGIEGDEEGCRLVPRPGKGQRVLCEDGTEWMPDGEDAGVECSWVEDFYVECSDGTVAQFEDTECEPQFAGDESGYEIECGDETLEVDDVEESWCGFPSGEFQLTSASGRAEEAMECQYVWGDLVVISQRDQELFALQFIEGVLGDVELRERRRVEEIEEGELWFVGGSVFVNENEELRYIDWLKSLEIVGASVDISGNESLRAVELVELRDVEDLVIVNNERLTELLVGGRWSDGWVAISLRGVFMFLDNESFPLCRGLEWLAWGGEVAEEGAYGGGFASAEESEHLCESDWTGEWIDFGRGIWWD